MWARHDYLREAFAGMEDHADDLNDADADYYDGLAADDLGVTLEAYRADRDAKWAAEAEARRVEAAARDLENDEIPF